MSSTIRRNVLLCAAVLTVSLTVTGAADDSPDLVSPDLLLSAELNPCPELPPEAVPVDYLILRTIEYINGGVQEAVVPDQEIPPGELAIYDRQIIANAVEYETAFGIGTDGANWETSRIVVFEEFTSYKFGALDGETRLSGVYLLGDSLIIRSTHTNYGPCQGIRQDPSWFSFGISYLLVVVPREPETILYSNCRIGDCPPDIP